MALSDSRQAGAYSHEVVVTDEMIAEGLHKLSERTFGEDLSSVLEAVFRAMAYESPQLRPASVPDTQS